MTVSALGLAHLNHPTGRIRVHVAGEALLVRNPVSASDRCREILSLTMSAESRVLWTWFCLHSEERIILTLLITRHTNPRLAL